MTWQMDDLTDEELESFRQLGEMLADLFESWGKFRTRCPQIALRIEGAVIGLCAAGVLMLAHRKILSA
jgi:hypothetical protein